MSAEVDRAYERCVSCRFYWQVNKSCGYRGCEYILHTGTRRPCPPGDECTVYQRKPNTRSKATKVIVAPYRWTASRLAFARNLISEGMTHREAAEYMGTTRDALQKALERDRKKEAPDAADLL